MTRSTLTRRLTGMVVAALLAGCAVNQPAPPVLDLPAGTATAEQNALLERWWVAFEDPILTGLIDEALEGNLDLAIALARIEAARAQLLLAQAQLMPDTRVRADLDRSRISSATSPPLEPGSVATSSGFRLAFEMSYEIDVWGKYRSGRLAAINDLVASRYFRETVRIAVAAETAGAYFRLRAADAELSVLENTLKLRTEIVTLQRDRFDGGIIGEYDLAIAEAERAAIVADIARTRKAIGLQEAALATLTGRSPRAVFAPKIDRGATIEAVTMVPELPAGLPSGLLERRPDIRRAEALLAAADLRIQEARANYFPSLNLTGAYGSESAALVDLFTSPAGIWRLGLGIVQPLLTLKYIESQVELATARRTQVTGEYRQTVQLAFRDVHDALLSHRSAREVLTAETTRREHVAKAYEVALLRYEAGRTSFLEVIDAQRQLLAADTLRVVAARDARLALVAFAKAVGGGWSPEQFAASP